MKKLLNKKGFTLMEMLIVVAIIVILVAIAVPTFSSNLDKAKKATDDANMRAAKAAVIIYDIDNDIPAAGVYYDSVTGDIVTTLPTVGYGQAGDAAGDVIKITSTNGTLAYEWVTPGTAE